MQTGDIPAAAEFLNACWRAAYAGILDAGFLDAMTTQTRIDILSEKLSRGLCGLIASDDDGAMIGVAMYGPTHLRILGDAGEINMIYVRPDHIGTGLGHVLFAQAEAALIGHGYSTLGLDVFSANLRAVRFYESHGYVRVGGKTDVMQGHEYPLDIMSRSVDTDASTAAVDAVCRTAR